MTALTPSQAARIVHAMRPLPDVRKKTRRERIRVEVTSKQSADDLQWLKKRYKGYTKGVAAAMAAHRAELESPLLTATSKRSLAYLQRLSDASRQDLIELALRYVEQELKAGRVVAVV